MTALETLKEIQNSKSKLLIFENRRINKKNKFDECLQSERLEGTVYT